MKRASTIVIVVVIALAALCASAQALTLIPGTYRVDWRIPDVGKGGHGVCNVHLMTDAERTKYKGVRSEKALFRESYRFTVIIDETAGTGSGYNVAYVFIESDRKEVNYLSNAWRLPLCKTAGGALISAPGAKAVVAYSDDPSTPLMSDPAGRAYGLQVLFDPESMAQVARIDEKPPAEGPPLACVRLAEFKWLAMIPSDAGDVDVDFGEKPRPSAEAGHRSAKDWGHRGFSVVRRDDKGVLRRNGLRTGMPVLYEGKLYRFDVLTGNRALRVTLLNVPWGTLKVEVGGQQGRVVELTGIEVTFKKGTFWYGWPKTEALPVGDYKLSRIGVRTPQGPKRKSVHRVSKKFRIDAGKTVVVALHFPSDIVPPKRAVRVGKQPGIGKRTIPVPKLSRIAHRGTFLEVNLPAVPGTQLEQYSGDMTLGLISPDGKVVETSTFPARPDTAIFIPHDCEPGVYTVEIKLDSSHRDSASRFTWPVKVLE